ncbi:hypothetical protein BJF77_05630 [Kocuria sp. CNJ-770]|nr:hypothetical protein BJF77_05630 [Kocuria sp. CNJ-770]
MTAEDPDRPVGVLRVASAEWCSVLTGGPAAAEVLGLHADAHDGRPVSGGSTLRELRGGRRLVPPALGGGA